MTPQLALILTALVAALATVTGAGLTVRGQLAAVRAQLATKATEGLATVDVSLIADGAAFRKTLLDENAKLRAEAQVQDGQLQQLYEEMRALRGRLDRCEAQAEELARLRGELAAERRQRESLERKVEGQRQEIAELRARLARYEPGVG